MKSAVPPLISLIVPMYNEEKAVEPFFSRVVPILKSVGEDYEIVCVNDGSSDNTLELLRRAATDPRIGVIDLSRNFGKEAALTAGLDLCLGQAVIPIDVDLQDPPEVILEMVSLWREGHDVVLAVRHDRSSDHHLKRLSARWFYRLIAKLSDTPIPENAGDFRLMDRQVVEALRGLPERTRFMKGIFAWLGFRTTQVTFVRPARQDGSAKQNYKSLFRLAMDGLVSFTTFPLRIWTLVGLCLSVLSALFLIFIVVQAICFGRDTPGYASLMTVMLFFNGIIMINLGMIGEYIARIFTEVKQRPVYLVRETINLTEPENSEIASRAGGMPSRRRLVSPLISGAP